MDTNSNNKINVFYKMKKLFHPLILSLIFSLIITSLYPILKDRYISEEVNTKAYLSSQTFADTLVELTSYLEQTKLRGINTWYDSRFEEVRNLQYYMIDPKTGLSTTNVSGLNNVLLDTLTRSSQCYLRVQFNGDSIYADGSMIGLLKPLSFRTLNNSYLDVHYMIPSTFIYNDDFIIRNIEAMQVISSAQLFLIIIILLLATLILLNSFIPYKLQQKIGVYQKYMLCSIESKLLFLLLPPILFYFFLISIGDEPYSIYYIKSLLIDTRLPYYVVSIFFSFITCLALLLTHLCIKEIYHIGFEESFLGRSYCFKFIKHYLPGTRKLYPTLKNKVISIFQIDITNYNPAQILALSCLSFIFCFIPILMADWFGFMGYATTSILYGCFFFYILSKLLNALEKLYHRTNQLADGNFGQTPCEDVGPFAPLANNLEVIHHTFEEAVIQEVKSQNMKTELISNVSHDLKTPLTSIINYVDFLKDESLTPEKRREYLAILDKKSIRLQSLIEDLFEASKAASGNIELHLENLDLAALLKQTLGELSEKLEVHNLQLRTTFPDTKCLSYLDGRRTYRIFENLISNISKYAQPGSRVYIQVLQQDTSTLVIFKNISAYEMTFDATNITERFNRGDASRHTEGSGLGLAIAKSLTELQNGSFEIYIDGDLFKVTLTFPFITETPSSIE